MKHIDWEKLNYAELNEDQQEALVNTPLGVFNFHQVANQFNLWIGHTDFVLDTNFLKGIRNITGVESFNNITPIRFLISFGKMFNEDDIKKKIENLVRVEDTNVLKAREKLQNYKDWAIYQFPNGNIETTHSEDFDFNDRVQHFSELKSDVGGRLIRPFSV